VTLGDLFGYGEKEAKAAMRAGERGKFMVCEFLVECIGLNE